MSEALFPHRKQPEICPQCGSPLHIRQGKKGLFLGCSAYSNCDFLVQEPADKSARCCLF
nr:topoisomerase DNA-binding C4 zinc finger domain-containing protein [Lonepinella koalarum]